MEVLPLVTLKRLPQAPSVVAGVFNYRGSTVPVVDLSQLTVGRPAAERLSTRIIIVKCARPQGDAGLLGLIAEEATGLLQAPPGALKSESLRICGAPYLGPVLMDKLGPIQLIDEQHLLAEPVRDRLFSDTRALGAGQIVGSSGRV